jgi:hypothetical protein
MYGHKLSAKTHDHISSYTLPQCLRKALLNVFYIYSLRPLFIINLTLAATKRAYGQPKAKTAIYFRLSCYSCPVSNPFLVLIKSYQAETPYLLPDQFMHGG